MLHRKPVAAILQPLSYAAADHRGDRHPANPDGALIFRDGGEEWLDLCRMYATTVPPAARIGDHVYHVGTVFPDGSVFEWSDATYEVMGHDRSGARLWVRRVQTSIDVPTTDEPDPEIRRTA